LKEGIKILFCARITFDPAYGLSLRIIDIDPGYSLGELEKEKFETIEKLRKEGIFNKNKEHPLPLLPQRIAIISVQTSKGYADFMRVIEGNEWGYHFFYLLFPAVLQGDNAPGAIINQLKKIKKVITHFDVVAIIRGGGGDVGLSCYNNFQLSKEVALFPIPVITGIGHSTNETVVEMVAFTNSITPTKLAEFLLQKFHNYSVPLKRTEEKLLDRAVKMIKEEKLRFYQSVKYFRSVTSSLIITGKHEVENQSRTLMQQSVFLLRRKREACLSVVSGIRKGSLSVCNATMQQVFREQEKLSQKSVMFVKVEKSKLEVIERDIKNMDPENVLKRGYSITLLNGKAVRSYEEVKEGDRLDTVVVDGTIISTVHTIKKSGEL
jgi:exodeoxyribonuclease VII large subunit